MPIMVRIKHVLRTTLMLLGVVLFNTPPTLLTASGSVSPSTLSCHCCQSGPANCATPTCCTAPTNESRPVSPASEPSRAPLEAKALVGSATVVLNVALAASDKVFPPATFLLPVRALPIFQRDCSYLI